MSHHERMVYGYLVFKHRDRKPVKTRAVAHALGLDKKTVKSAIDKLSGWGLASGGRSGYAACEPSDDHLNWFPWKSNGESWPERLCTHRVYILNHEARRSRHNPRGHLTELDNAIFWLLHSLGKGSGEIVGKTPRRLATILGSSFDTVTSALERLAANGLVMRRSDGFTLLVPGATALNWWSERKPRTTPAEAVQSVTTETIKPTAPVVLTKESFDTLVKNALPRWSSEQRDGLPEMIMDKTTLMLAQGVSTSEAYEYWRKVVPCFAGMSDTEAILFFSGAWNAVLQEAVSVHREKGRVKSCIHLLTTNTLNHFSR